MKSFNKRNKPKHTTRVKYTSNSVYAYAVWAIRTSEKSSYSSERVVAGKYQRDSL